MSNDAEFLRMLRATFKVEAAEHLQAIAAGLLELEKVPAPAQPAQIIETVFRAAHSLKGAARAVDFTQIESLCQSLESAFAAWKHGTAQPSPAALDVAHRAIDAISDELVEPVAAVSPRPGPTAMAAVTAQPHPPLAAAPSPTAVAPSPSTTADSDTVRISVNSLDARLWEAEEMLAAKFAVGQRKFDLSALASEFEDWRKRWTGVQPSLGEHAKVIELNQDYARAFEGKLTALRRAVDQDCLTIGKLVDDLLENSKKLLMLPLATLGGLLPKLVRDLSRDQGKQVDFAIQGEEVRIDRRILEEMKDPLIHLLRNCIDHGIELPGERQRDGKSPRASIKLAVIQLSGNQVELTVSDDGAGVDTEKVKAAAVRSGLLTPTESETLSESAALELVFAADLSTSPMITKLSGRGLGLAIVREKAEKLGGRVTIESRRSAGTTIRMTLPLTLATFRGVLIESARRLFVVPTAQVERVTRFKLQDIQTVKGRNTVAMNGRALALADLADVLQLPAVQREPAARITALILGAGEQRMAFAVDAVLDEREVLVKPLTKPLSRVRNIAGATVLGSGEVAPILNVSDLLKSARRTGAAPRVTGTPELVTPSASRKVLVAEDSITSRMLLKGILESAGYDVKTAVDGIEAFTALRAESFDVLISDVEMPRMNGFELTTRVRADRTLAELPVVLVTALESREDRERGVDAGANAYLVKSSLDQGNLLEALRRLA